LATHGTPIDPLAESRHHVESAGDTPRLKLGRYEVVRELGKGAMGIVYLAKDPLIGRLVALKTIRSAAHADDDETREFQQRFIREAQAAGILNHPAIVTVHDIGQDDATNTNFIAMEYVEGQNLKEVLAQGRALTFEQIADIVAQVADALDFAHSKGIVHRDVKPANIILIEGHRAKITDFGIAKIASSVANLTSTGQFLGTPNYMAPEQIKGAPVDGRTDIFALGICLYECLTRRKPFGGDSLTSISYKIVHEAFPPLAEINPQIPDGYEEVIANCLAKDPAKRYQRARDMAAALRSVIRGEKPVRPPDPMLAEETMVTRLDRDRISTPTLEVPFPEAIEVDTGGNPVAPKEMGGSTRPAAAKAAAAAAAAQAMPRTPRQPIGQQFRRTLTNVRALPLWRRRIAPPIFAAIVAVLVAGLIFAVAGIRSKSPVMPKEDKAAYQLSLKATQLREEAQVLVREGKVGDAYLKYEELSKLAPHSPFVNLQKQKLGAILQSNANSQQQQLLAQQKFDEGKVLFDQKKYVESIPLFQEAFTLNPNLIVAGDYLKNAQVEDQKIQAAKVKQRATTPSKRDVATATTGTTTTHAQTATETAAANDTPAQFTTTFTHNFTDGSIIVKFGADTVLHAPLWEEVGRFLTKRKRAKPVNVTKEVVPKNADVQVWVTVASLKINEYHVIPATRFTPGSSHHLNVIYNAGTKTFAYEFN